MLIGGRLRSRAATSPVRAASSGIGVACIPLSSRVSELTDSTERLRNHHAAALVAP
jgi:hypothetical protein